MGSITEEPASGVTGPGAAPAAENGAESADVSAAAPAGARLGRVRLWGKYAAGSVVATVLSQIAFTVCYGKLDTSAAVASVVAFVAGAVPNYVLNRAWAWNDSSVPRRRALITYLIVIGVTNGLAIGITTLANDLVRGHVASHGTQTLLVDLAYLSTTGVMFVVKFLLFDGLVFNRRAGRAPARPAA